MSPAAQPPWAGPRPIRSDRLREFPMRSGVCRSSIRTFFRNIFWLFPSLFTSFYNRNKFNVLNVSFTVSAFRTLRNSSPSRVHEGIFVFFVISRLVSHTQVSDGRVCGPCPVHPLSSSPLHPRECARAVGRRLPVQSGALRCIPRTLLFALPVLAVAAWWLLIQPCRGAGGPS